jgi:taurine dioxygenase
MAIKLRRLSHALGAEVSGVDFGKPIDDGTFKEIRTAFLEHCVLLFRGQHITREQHIAFTRHFGPLDMNEWRAADTRIEGYPELILVASRPKPDGSAATGRYAGAEWHTDNSHTPVAAAASLLRCVELPGVGGDTMFANMYRAYETLSDGMKKLIEPLQGVHMLTKAVYDASTFGKLAESYERFPAAAHPVVRVHPESGRRALYVNEQVRLFVGMTSEESRPLLRYLCEHAVRPQNVYRHTWQEDDLVIWDNRCLLHMALGDFDRKKVRHMERTTIHADKSGYAYTGPPQ